MFYTFFVRNFLAFYRPSITPFLKFLIKLIYFYTLIRSSFYFTAYHFILPFVTFAYFNRLCIRIFVV